uniref:Integrin, alpha 10 n=1 Tax=Hucho hucho TaxID=62062 RepID=A0A4W5MS78_9TELE
MDIVIVLDGSNSIYPWYEVQNFLSNILSKFHISPEQMQVGVLQYGEVAVHEWSLRDYQTTQEVVEAAKNISRQEGRETRTAYAIHMGCTEAFSPERGAREGATKVMIVVTDGESHDGEELPDALEECEKRNITRYAIAVLGHYIRRQQDPETFISEIKYIASDPDDKYFFNVTDEAALNDIVDALGDRIFTLEGTLGYNESSFKFEMSQIGFSTHVLDDGILFGMVGAYDWDGGVLKEGAEGRIMPTRESFESEFPQELKNHAAYLGYTVSSVIVGDWRRLYVAGAPRFKHKGKVILFELSNNGDVNIAQALNGEQIGSYYGSEVCGLDVDQDGITDVLLVAAPMYLGPGNKEAGRVYIYSLSGEEVFVSNGTLKAEDRSQDARFGYALASAPDLNHDGYTDLLVGAPLEDGHNGAIYVYHGQGIHIIHNYKQVDIHIIHNYKQVDIYIIHNYKQVDIHIIHNYKQVDIHNYKQLDIHIIHNYKQVVIHIIHNYKQVDIHIIHNYKQIDIHIIHNYKQVVIHIIHNYKQVDIHIIHNYKQINIHIIHNYKQVVIHIIHNYK